MPRVVLPLSRRRRAAARNPRDSDQARPPLVAGRAALRITPPVRALHPHATIRTPARAEPQFRSRASTHPPDPPPASRTYTRPGTAAVAASAIPCGAIRSRRTGQSSACTSVSSYRAVRSHRLTRNPAATASPPSARQARAPEMHPWDAAQLAAFLGWSAGHSKHHPVWTLLAMTGMRRGEAPRAPLARRRPRRGHGQCPPVGRVVRVKGEGATVAEGDTKSGKPRVIDIDATTVAVLRAHRRERGAVALQLARDDALVFGDYEGRHLRPERFSRTFHAELARARKVLGADKLPVIRLHDLRHTHATILLTAREPVHVVSQRLGHASGVITQTVYAHVLPGSQREAAERFASLIERGKAQ